MAMAERLGKHRGVVLVLCMLFITVFSSLGLLIMQMSVANAQTAQNHHLSNTAMSGALSAMELGQYALAKTPTFSTGRNTVSAIEADAIWTNLLVTLSDGNIGGLAVAGCGTFSDAGGSGEEIVTDWINYGGGAKELALRFYRYDSEPVRIRLSASGRDGTVARQVTMEYEIGKQADVLNYSIASRGRMWVTQNSVIHGPVLSTWNRPEVGPGIETASDTCIGTVNTIIALEDIQSNGYQMETLDGDNNPVLDEDGNRVHSAADKIQGEHEGINYGVPFDEKMPGMSPDDYDTSEYKMTCSNIGAYNRIQREYFPHIAGNYGSPSSSSSKRYDRKVYENQTFSNMKIPKGTHALFVNCTFKDVLFVETNASYSDSTSGTNNIRFDNCNFYGAIVTDVPSSSNHYSWWMRNVLYFTGEATFDNQSAMQETTILAPNFNVNLGNTGELDEGNGNVLTGAIVGGIVDIRGNADICGTIISMYDTSAFSSGYVTNIGAADDGGSESAGYVGGTISITPNPDQLLPSGITTPIIIKAARDTYNEGISTF